MTYEDEEQLQSIVYFLSDHVCTAIEAGEAIYAQSYEASQSGANLSANQILSGQDEFQRFIDVIRHYEYLILTHLSQARHWGGQLRQLDSEFRPVIDLFATATDLASDANTLLGEDEEAVFNGAGDPLSFIAIREMKILERGADGLPLRVEIGEDYLLGGQILLSGLIEVSETFHDTMASRYAVFNNNSNGADTAHSIASGSAEQ